MTVSIRYAISTDGAFDKVIRYHIDWALKRLCECSFVGDWVDPRVFDSPVRNMADRAAKALGNYSCNLLVVHRDSEQIDPSPRYTEIVEGLRAAGVGTRFVAAVPVRMTEAWLLIDEQAIRTAAGNPNGVVRLPLPAIRRLESVPDPKRVLEQCLEVASGKSGRRLEIFQRDLPAMKHRVAELIEDFTPLLEVASFRRFYEDLSGTLVAGGFRVAA